MNPALITYARVTHIGSWLSGKAANNGIHSFQHRLGSDLTGRAEPALLFRDAVRRELAGGLIVETTLQRMSFHLAREWMFGDNWIAL